MKSSIHSGTENSDTSLRSVAELEEVLVGPVGPSEVSSTAARLRRSEYEAYIGSNAWLRNPSRLAEKAASGHRCRGCNRGADETQLQVHHRTYANFGNELPSDLTTLCVDCHPAITDIIRRRRYSVRAPIFADVATATCAVPLFDPISRGDWS
jgi:hypothetical protein